MSGGNITPQQIQAILGQTQPGTQQGAPQMPGTRGLLDLMAHTSAPAQPSTPQLYQNWTQSLLAPYMKQYAPSQADQWAQTLQQILAAQRQFGPGQPVSIGGGN